ncbi:MAG TPA: terminase family protein [Terriglobales bacterium]|nr:terminase family protein [Terriglobales bacterium]
MNRQELRAITALKWDWLRWARSSQLPPPEFVRGEKQTWLLLSGRGGGKTRASAELVRRWVNVEKFSRVNLIGPTHDDVRDIMVEGESGVLAVCPHAERPRYISSRRMLEWPSGAISLCFSADEPERLRGKQHEKFWGDEPASWRCPETLDQAYFGLRLGGRPQAVLSTTPKPTKLVKSLLADPTVIVTRGTSYENRANLAPAFLSKIITKYENTRLGRQELLAELLDDNPGALFLQATIDAARVDREPELVRIVGGIDPATTSGPDADDTGIVYAGRDNRKPPHFYVLDDLTCNGKPEVWARRAVVAYHRYQADRIVAETNQGGDMVEATIRNVDSECAYRGVHATKGKAIRAEPISALYDQGRVHHVGILPALEDEICDFVPGQSVSPNRMDALVWSITDLMGHGGYEHGLIEFWGQQAEAMKNKSAESEPGQSIVDLGRAQIEAMGQTGNAMFGVLKSKALPTSRVKDVNGRAHLPSVCPNPHCGKALAVYANHVQCVCGWDSRSEAAPQPEPVPAPETVKRPLSFQMERLLG